MVQRHGLCWENLKRDWMELTLVFWWGYKISLGKTIHPFQESMATFPVSLHLLQWEGFNLLAIVIVLTLRSFHHYSCGNLNMLIIEVENYPTLMLYQEIQLFIFRTSKQLWRTGSSGVVWKIPWSRLRSHDDDDDYTLRQVLRYWVGVTHEDRLSPAKTDTWLTHTLFFDRNRTFLYRYMYTKANNALKHF